MANQVNLKYESFLRAKVELPEGGDLTVSSSYAGNGSIQVEVADTGRGIAPQDVGRVFEAFFTTKEDGTGLGLAIVKNIIETYDGTITVESEPGKGTRFRIVLPTRSPANRGVESAELLGP